MKIETSAVGMESARNYSQISRETYTHTMVRNPQKFTLYDVTDGEDESAEDENGEDEGSKRQSLKESLYDLMERFESSRSDRIRSVSGYDEDMTINEIRSRCIEYLLALLLGKDYTDSNESLTIRDTDNYLPNLQNSLYNMDAYEYSYEESEETSFSAVGTVVTSDGREISFNLTANMSRSFSEYASRISEHTVNLCDPLVINLDGNVTQVSDQSFYFDLDCDGTDEKVAMLCGGSSFLALDKNNDGEINDGSELFGASSGDGFSDLSEYDEDQNGWIDENDDIFSKLRVFSVDESGNRTLVDLKSAGVGAMYLGNAETDFTLKDVTSGGTLARIRKSGIFLYEDGAVGSMMQVDLAVDDLG